MRLLVISHTPHHRRDGVVVGFGATVRELDELVGAVDALTHLAPLHDGPAPASDRPYRADGVRFVGLAAAGGSGIRAKLALLRALPRWALQVRREVREADAVQVRCPAVVALVALVVLSTTRRPAWRWAKYAGNWKPEGGDPLSYRVQRWWLRHRLHRGPVTVNGTWPDDGPHVRAFPNPTLTDDELGAARGAARGKSVGDVAQLIYVGRVEEPKGAGRAVDVVAALRARGRDVRLVVVGDGPLVEELRARAAAPELAGAVELPGALGRAELDERYAAAHVLLLPTRSSEGFPKVIAEAMAHGAVPVTSTVSSIPQWVADTGAGLALDPVDVDGLVDAVAALLDDPARWCAHRDAGLDVAAAFTYGAYLDRLDEMARATWGAPLTNR
jgi:glycosyltransferase involved in cell wall biosynthesis